MIIIIIIIIVIAIVIVVMIIIMIMQTTCRGQPSGRGRPPYRCLQKNTPRGRRPWENKLSEHQIGGWRRRPLRIRGRRRLAEAHRLAALAALLYAQSPY